MANEKRPFQRIISNLMLWLFFFVAFGSTLYTLAAFWSEPHHITFFLNPDMSASTYMARNLIYEHGSLLDWNMGIAPYFVPEIVFLYITTLFFKSPYTNFLIFSSFQIISFTVITIVIFKSTLKSITGLRLGVISALIYLLILALKHPFHIYSHDDYMSAIFAPGFHFGVTLMVFTALFLFLKILINPKTYLIVILSLLLLVSGVSDSLTHIYFTFPAIATMTILYYFKQLPGKKYIKLSLLFIMIFIISYMIIHFMPIHVVRLKLKPSFHLFSLWELLADIYNVIRSNFFVGGIWLFFLIFAPISLRQTYIKKIRPSHPVDYIILFQLLTIFVSGALIYLAIGQTEPAKFYLTHTSLPWHHLNHYLEKMPHVPYRYLIPFIVGPVFFGFPCLLYKHAKFIKKIDKKLVFVNILLIIAVVALACKKSRINEKNLLSYQPKFAICFDQHAKKLHLQNGISSDYIVANMLTAYNRSGAHVAFVNEKLMPLGWDDTGQVFRYHHYNFAIFTDQELIANKFFPSLLTHFGNPTNVFTCKGEIFHRYYVYVYNNNVMNHIFDHRV